MTGLRELVAGTRGIRPFPLTRPEADLLALLLSSGLDVERCRLSGPQLGTVTNLRARLDEFRSRLELDL